MALTLHDWAHDSARLGGFFYFIEQEIDMASKTMKTEIIRHRKHASNRVNLKAEQKRLQSNVELLGKLERESAKK